MLHEPTQERAAPVQRDKKKKKIFFFVHPTKKGGRFDCPLWPA